MYVFLSTLYIYCPLLMVCCLSHIAWFAGTVQYGTVRYSMYSVCADRTVEYVQIVQYVRM